MKEASNEQHIFQRCRFVLIYHRDNVLPFQVRDGGGLYAEILGQYCGDIPPLPVVSGSNKLWIRLHSDGTAEGTGATATLDVVDCKRIFILTMYFTISMHLARSQPVILL
jgi:hypothetical protein